MTLSVARSLLIGSVVVTARDRTSCDLDAVEQVVDALHEPVWLVASSGTIVHENAAARAINSDVRSDVHRASAEDFRDPRFIVSRLEIRGSILSFVVARRSISAPPLPPSLARVASLAAFGKSDKDISRALETPLSTVRTYMQRIYARLGLRSRAELAGYWLQR